VHVPSWLERAARARPGTVAVEAAGGTLTYAALEEATAGAAGALRASGLGRGDRVALALSADLPFVVALHACLRLGAVAVPVDLRLSGEERAARTAGCAAIVEAPLEDGPPVAAAPHDLDAPAVVLFTSGTSAAPRPVVLTAGNLLWSALGSAVALGLDPAERWLCALPVAHVGGLSIVLRSAIYATTAVLHPRFDVEAVLRDLARATLVSLVPTTLARLLDAGLREPPVLRAALLGGAPVPPALLRRAAGARVPVITTYGLTEAASQVTTGGPPLFCTRVRIGVGGEVLVAGPTVAPAALAADGWLHTGDLGALDEDGGLTSTGRAAETIVTGGENVAPVAVEAVLTAHPAVADAGVHGHPDPVWGEAVVATVVLREGASATEDELRAHARAHLAPFAVPKAIAFASELPRTPSGKLLRRAL
jgi:O-succinylbenzoic acid--CoA ligase